MTHNFGPWIIHEGNECPVEPDALVQVICSDEEPRRHNPRTLAAEMYDWDLQGLTCRIFAYRKVIAPKRVKVRGHIYGCSDGTMGLYEGHGHHREHAADFTLSFEVDENDKPIPGTVRLEDA